jgi:putative transcriptional regulator
MALAVEPTDGAAQPDVEGHVAGCASCAARLRELRDDLGLAVLTQTEPGSAAAATNARTAPTADALKHRMLAATQPNDAAALVGFHRRICRMFDLDDAAGHAVLKDATGEQAWQMSGPLSLFHFHPGPSLSSIAEAGVIRLAPGVTFPRHRHIGDEYGLVLAGVLRDDGSGRIGMPGDVLFMPKDSTHTVTAISRDPCLFLVLLYGGTPEIEWC